jgi:hypothetical protein
MRILLIAFGLLLPYKGIGGEDDPLHKRKFYLGLTEVKNGGAKKSISDVIYFKNGKLFTDHLHRKFGYSWIRYRIEKDTVYIDHTDTEVRLLEVAAVTTDEDNQTVILEFTVLEWDLDGVMKLTKNDKLRRYYDMAGREKGGKPKKEKRRKSPDYEPFDQENKT